MDSTQELGNGAILSDNTKALATRRKPPTNRQTNGHTALKRAVLT